VRRTKDSVPRAKQRRLLVEDLLRPIAVVDVPVEDRNPLHARRSRRRRRGRHRVVEATPLGEVALEAVARRVVPWRAHQRERMPGPSRCDGGEGGVDDGAACESRGRVRLGREVD